MSKKKTSKILAVALCATTMAAFYAAPVMAGSDFIASNNASVGVTDNAEITFNINGQRVGDVTNVNGVVKMDVKGKYVGEELEIKPADATGSFKVANIEGNTMIYTMDGTSGVPSFMVNAANGNIESVGSMKIANGLLEVSKEGNAVTAGGVHMQEGALEASTILAGGSNFKVAADGAITATSFNGVTMETSGDKVLVGGVDVKAVSDGVAGIRRATKADAASTYIEDTVRVNNKSGLWVYKEDGKTVAASIDRAGNAKFNAVDVEGNVVANGVGRFGSLTGSNVRMENGELTINSSATNKVVSMSVEGLKVYGDDGKLNVLLTREGGLALNQNLSVGGNVAIAGTINGASITDTSFNGVNISELKNGFDTVSKNSAGFTRSETAVNGKYTTTTEDNFVVNGADGSFHINQVVPNKTMIYTEAKDGTDTMWLDPATGNFSVKGTIGVGGLGDNAKTFIDGTTGSMAIGGKNGSEKIHLDAQSGDIITTGTINGGNITASGAITAANGAFSVKEDGSIASQFAADGALVANKDGFAVAKGANSVNVNEHGVGLAAGADNQVSVTKDGIGLQAGTSQVIMNSKNGIVFRNGDKDANGETVINGGNITATGTINGATITDKAFNGVDIYDGKVDGVDVSDLSENFGTISGDVGTLRTDVNTLRGDVNVLRGDVDVLRTDTNTLRTDFNNFYKEYQDKVNGYDSAIKDLQDKTQHITADENGTHFDGDVTVNGNVGVGGDASTNGGNIGADSGVIGGVGMENGNIAAGSGTIGGVGMENGNIAAGSGTIGGVGMENGNIAAGSGTIGGVGMENGNIAANSGTIGGVGMENGNIAANSGTIGGVGMENGNIAANSGTIGKVTITDDKVVTGDTTVSKDGVTIGGENGTSVSKDDVVINKGTDKEVSLSNVGGRVDNLEQGLADANSRIDRVDEKIDKVGAMAAAIANLRTMGYDPEAPTEIAVGVGQYRSETGAALGFFHYPNRDFMLSMSVSTSGDEVMGGIGATWKFGRKTPAEMKAAKERAAEKAKLEKAAAIKKAAELAKVEKQQQRHAELAAKKAAK